MAYDIEKVMETYHTRLDVQNMRRIFSYGRPASAEMETWWVNTYLFTPEMQAKGMYKDGFEYKGEVGEGNCILKIGEGSKTLFSSHTDTVHRTGVKQNVFIDPLTRKYTTDSGQCLGGDDGTGIWLMLELIKAEVPGLYIFHRAEEVGGQGSSYIANQTPELIEGYHRAIAFDRKDDWSIITCQSGVRTCSDDFANVLSTELGMDHKPDTTGAFTDTANYDTIIPECTNLSVGYHNAHTARENQEIDYVLKFRNALIKVDWENLPTIRDPQETKYDYGGYYGYGGLVKPARKTRESSGWNDWDDYAFEKRKAKDEEEADIYIYEDDDDTDGEGVIFIDDLEKDFTYLYEMRISDMTDEEVEIYERLQSGESSKDFFDDHEDYLDWLDDQIEDETKNIKKKPSKEDIDDDIYDPDDIEDADYDWDSWFAGFEDEKSKKK